MDKKSREYKNALTRKRYAENPHARREGNKRSNIKAKYGITLEEKDALLVGQGGVCAICKTAKPPTVSGWHVDHCHSTKTVRGILCQHCNNMLGMAKDDTRILERAKRYVTMNHGIKCLNQVVNDKYAIYHGDCFELIRAVPSESIDFTVFSPPFSGLYKFSNSDRDLSNSEGDQFFEHFQFLIQELLRVTVPGRLCSVHVMQLPMTKIRDGAIGMRDFRGEVIRAYEDSGWILHSEVCIWKDPVVAQQRTKSIRLLHAQIVKDSSISGQGLADYIVTFRKPGDNPKPIKGGFTRYIGEPQDEPDRSKYTMPMDNRNWYSIEVWQRYASPVWMDIRQTRTLQYRKARHENDEAHISPLQLDVVERCLDLWSNPGDKVLTPFMGIGTEVYCAVASGRYGIGFELKDTYFPQAVRNIAEIAEVEKTDNLFGRV